MLSTRLHSQRATLMLDHKCKKQNDVARFTTCPFGREKRKVRERSAQQSAQLHRESILHRKISRKIIQALPPPQKLARPPCARIPWNRCIPSDSGIAPACRRRPSTARRSKLSNRDTIDTREIDCEIEMRMNERRLRVGLACSNLG